MERLFNWAALLVIRSIIMAASLVPNQALLAGDPVFPRATQGLTLVFVREKGPMSPRVKLPDGSYLGMIVEAKAFDSMTGPHFREGDTILWKGAVDVSQANKLIFGDNKHIYCIDDTHGMIDEFLLELRNDRLYITAFKSLSFANLRYGLDANKRFLGRIDQWVFFREKDATSSQIKYFDVGNNNTVYSIDIQKSNIKYLLNVSRSRKRGEIIVYAVFASEALIAQFPQYVEHISVPFPSEIQNY